MSARDDMPEERQELYRRGVAFLKGARDLPDLTPAQLDRVERRLARSQEAAGGRRPLLARRMIVAPVLVALAVVLVAGAALAVAGRDLSAVPIVARLFRAIGGAKGPARSAGGARGAARPAPAQRAASDPASPLAPPVAPALTAAAGGTPPAATRQERRAPAAWPRAAGARNAEREAEAPPTSAAVVDPDRSRPPAAMPSDGMGAPGAGDGHGTEAARAGTTPPPVAAPATAPAPVPAPAAAASPGSPIVAESRSFSAALARWHRDHDARAALAALDAHEQRFPHGEIRLEAQILRAEIVLAQGHEREALALLDPLPLAGVPRARELRTVRGELRIKHGRCAEGKADLGAVLAQGIADALAERARRALAKCP